MNTARRRLRFFSLGTWQRGTLPPRSFCSGESRRAHSSMWTKLGSTFRERSTTCGSSGTEWNSEVMHRFITRFRRYKESLFVFLTEDAIPWNNNTGERAIRHLAVQRKISGTFYKSFASHHLVLLGIAQTCRFQEKSFLK